MDELKKQFEYYVKNQDELVSKYNGKYVVIVDETVVGDYDSETEAYAEATSKYGPGKFMLQLVGPGEESYTQTFYSRVTI